MPLVQDDLKEFTKIQNYYQKINERDAALKEGKMAPHFPPIPDVGRNYHSAYRILKKKMGDIDINDNNHKSLLNIALHVLDENRHWEHMNNEEQFIAMGLIAAGKRKGHAVKTFIKNYCHDLGIQAGIVAGIAGVIPVPHAQLLAIGSAVLAGVATLISEEIDTSNKGIDLATVKKLNPVFFTEEWYSTLLRAGGDDLMDFSHDSLHYIASRNKEMSIQYAYDYKKNIEHIRSQLGKDVANNKDEQELKNTIIMAELNNIYFQLENVRHTSNGDHEKTILSILNVLHGEMQEMHHFQSAKENERLSVAKQAIVFAKFQGVMDGFNTLATLGNHVNNRALQVIGVTGAALVQGIAGATQLAAGFAGAGMGLAMLTPATAIIGSVLMIANLFMKKKGDEGFTIILKQIAKMHQDMIRGFNLTMELIQECCAQINGRLDGMYDILSGIDKDTKTIIALLQTQIIKSDLDKLESLKIAADLISKGNGKSNRDLFSIEINKALGLLKNQLLFTTDREAINQENRGNNLISWFHVKRFLASHFFLIEEEINVPNLFWLSRVLDYYIKILPEIDENDSTSRSLTREIDHDIKEKSTILLEFFHYLSKPEFIANFLLYKTKLTTEEYTFQCQLLFGITNSYQYLAVDLRNNRTFDENDIKLISHAIKKGAQPTIDYLNNIPLFIEFLKVSSKMSTIHPRFLESPVVDEEVEEEQTSQAKQYTCSLPVKEKIMKRLHEWSEYEGVDINEILELLVKAFSEIESAQGKELVLFLGATGVGKSTLINYLMGCFYKRVQNDRGFYEAHLDPDSPIPEVVKVGHTKIGKTLFPKVVTKEGLNFSFADLAGFFDTRGNIKRICGASTTYLLNRMAKGIKRIVVVIDAHSFEVSRGQNFKDVAIALGKIVKNDFALILDTVSFVITKTNNFARKEAFKEDISSILEEEDGLFDQQKRNTLSPDEEALMNVLDIMRHEKCDMSISTIFDQGEHANEFITKLANFTSQSPDLFDFMTHDGSQERFNALLFEIIYKFLNEMNRLKMIDDELYRLHDDIKEKNTHIQYCKKEIKEKKSEKKIPAYSTFELDNQNKALKQEKIEKENALKVLDEHKVTLSDKKNTLNQEINDVNTEELVHIKSEPYKWEAAYCTYEDIFGPFRERARGHGKHKFSISADTPIRHYVVTPNDKFKHLKIEDNVFKATFTFKAGWDANAEVALYSHKRDINEGKIKELRGEISLLEQRETTANIDGNKLKDAIDLKDKEIKEKDEELTTFTTNGKIVEALRNDRLTREIEELQGSISQTLKDIDDANTQIEEDEFEKAAIHETIKGKQQLFYMVAAITDILQLENKDNPHLIANFTKALTLYFTNASEQSSQEPSSHQEYDQGGTKCSTFANGVSLESINFVDEINHLDKCMIIYDTNKRMSAARETMSYRFFSLMARSVNSFANSAVEKLTSVYQHTQLLQQINSYQKVEDNVHGKDNVEMHTILPETETSDIFDETDQVLPSHPHQINESSSGQPVQIRECDPLSLAITNNNHAFRQESLEQYIAFDSGSWDTNTYNHPGTGAPLFIYRVYKNGLEAGSAIFYQHPLLCRSEDGTRHNIIALNGVLVQFDIESKLQTVEDICQALPPTLVEELTQSTFRGAQHGIMRGTAKVVSYALEIKGYSQQVTHYANYAVYYGGMFAMQYVNYYSSLASSNMSETQKMTTAAYQATLDTGTLVITRTVIDQGCQLFNWFGQKAQEYGWQKTGKALQLIGNYGQCGVFMYQSVTQGALQNGATIASGIIAEKAVTKFGKYSLEKVIGVNGFFNGAKREKVLGVNNSVNPLGRECPFKL